MLTSILICVAGWTHHGTRATLKATFGLGVMPQFLYIINVNKNTFTLQLYTEKL